MKAKERSVTVMAESVEVRNICDWVRFKDRKDMGGTPVNLIPGNENAARIYMLCRRQTINVWNGEQDIPVDLNHLAVWAAIDHTYGSPMCKITDPYECFIKVNEVFHCLLEERMLTERMEEDE
jgi:hypothetical protein